jgi:ribosomal protein S27AE
VINREGLYVDSTGRIVLTEELCRHCGAPSREMHPAGVVAGKWHCTRCDKTQAEIVSNHLEEV